MTTLEPTVVAATGAFPWLRRSRTLSVLWMMRMLVRLHGYRELISTSEASARGAVLQRLRLPEIGLEGEPQRKAFYDRLSLTLSSMDLHARNYRHGRAMEANLALLGQKFSLTAAERSVFALAVLLRSDDELYAVSRYAKPQISPADQIAKIVGMPSSDVHDALSPRGRLRQSGLIEIANGHSPAQNLRLRRGELRRLAVTRVASVDAMFREILHPCAAASLAPADYAHLVPTFGFVAALLGEALTHGRRGVNVLLHGAPGTGKTELTRTLAGELGVPLFDMASTAENGEPLDPKDRLAAAATAQHLLADRRALLAFDEVDAIFNDGSDFFGKPTTAESAKAWVNQLLEKNQAPTVWIANQIRKMDPAFMRRFDLIIELGVPPMQQRLQLLQRKCGDYLEPAELRRLAHVEGATPAVVARAASVLRRVPSRTSQRSAIMEAVLDGTLKAQGHATVRRASRAMPPPGYDLTLCNAHEDLSALAMGLGRVDAGRVCLYGPPGTGKTAFGYWLADTLKKPLEVKRMSDLQSPYVGVMERKLADAFEQATRDGAILQIDEVDSFLRDRRTARQAWEVSQVNEFLTQLETFDGIFLASTNLMEGLDPAALRRFDYKIRIDYLRPDQARKMLRQCLVEWGMGSAAGHRWWADLDGLDRLTPGDFAVVSRRHALVPFRTAEAVVAALAAEQGLKGGAIRKIGFI